MPLPSIFLQQAPRAASIILGGLLAYQLALLSWSFFSIPDSQYQWLAPKVTTTANNNKINTLKLQQLHLFGEAQRAKATVKNNKPVNAAPKTTLNLTLVGVVAASDPEYSSAIISYKGRQGSYFIDSEIEGTAASIAEIYADRVILDVDGVLQTLFLDDLDSLQKNNQPAQPLSREEPAEEEVKPVEVDIDRSAILKDPGKLTDYIRISPYRRDGSIVGYRLRPGRDRTLFEQAGLENNDLAIELNGVDLTDTQQAFSLMKDFPTMTEISLTVDRNGQLHELYLSIP